MARQKITKTNALRILDKQGIGYETRTYEAPDGFLDGVSVALQVGMRPEKVYKTLVLQSANKEYYICVIPVNHELDLKKVATHFESKRVEMIPSKDITNLTGYIKGGCSPIGMKKAYQTVIANEAINLDKITVSAGKVGLQMTLLVEDLLKVIHADFGEITQS